MTFTYLDQPELFVGVSDENSRCDLCHRQKPCFDAAGFFGEDELAFICPECLSNGRLYERDSYTCQGDVAELKRQLHEANPALNKADIDDLADHKTLELEKTTPHLVTWQDWEWPCADGDYARFIGYGSKPLYKQLANDSDAQSLFEQSLYYTLKEECEPGELWEDVPKKAIPDYAASSNYSTLFYVFKSLHSDQIITLWDSD
ncbi:CbrC family protein [Larkinella sp. GY13]|uniref:CbrC family protein n=1 Tax=Larkinella sp. GY13 TaxID=3453720 RepID=UPI003EEA66F0